MSAPSLGAWEQQGVELVRFVARRLCLRLPPNVEEDELVADGYVGLIDAVSKFDSAKGASFKTYAELRIRGAMLDGLRTRAWMSRPQRERTKRIEAVARDLEQRLGHAATAGELADALGITVDRLDEIRAHPGEPMPFLVSEDGAEVVPADAAGVDPILEIDRALVAARVREAVARLPIAERTVVTLYFYSESDQIEIADLLGVTESRVCQILNRALRRLRFLMRDA